jgi:uncharacterized protein
VNTVAVIGASKNRFKYGNKAVRAFRQQGYTVWPVNPRETMIEGLPTYKNLAGVPGRPQMVSVYLPPAAVLKVLAEAARLGLNVVQACSIIGAGLSPESF